jgi:subfamily B ATP-binding cassette protein MsbA
MIVFLRKLWGFVRPYRGRFLLGLLCGVLFGLVNGLLLGAVKVVVQLVFEGETNLHQQLESAPKWIHPLSHQLAALVPEMHAPAPNDTLRWLLIIGTIPAIMVLRNTLQYLSIYLTNWSAMHAIADIRTKLFSHLQNLSLGFFSHARTGDLIARITNDTQVLYGIIGSSFASLAKDPITILCLLGYQLSTQPTLTLISIVVFTVCIVPIVIF